MGKAPVEQKDRNFEFYRRWRKNGENVYDLIREYDFSLGRAYQIKKKIEQKYPEFVLKMSQN